MQNKKIVIISDLHANLDILDVFMDYINRQKIELVLNLGDYISGGPNPCEVFDKIINDKRFINIRGYDENQLFHTKRENDEVDEIGWLKKKLGVERVKKIYALPSTKSISIDQVNILMCHTNGWADITQAIAHHQHSQFTNRKYNYIAFGGSHTQELMTDNHHLLNSKIIAPGSLCRDKQERGHFVILNCNQKEAYISFQSIDLEKITNPFESNSDRRNKQRKTNMEGGVEEIVIEPPEDNMFYIYKNEDEGENSPYIEDEIINSIIEIGVRKCKYICIGCWEQEKQTIRELLYYLKCRRIITNSKSGQMWYIGEITEEVEKLIKEKRKLPFGRLKWFEISFQERINSKSPKYSIYNYGKEAVLKKLVQSELHQIKSLTESYEVKYQYDKKNPQNKITEKSAIEIEESPISKYIE